VERATTAQKPLAEKLLELYKNEIQFDPELKLESEPQQSDK